MNLRSTVSWLKERMQVDLFPHLAEVFTDPMTEKQKKLIAILEVVEIERHIKSPAYQWMGRKLKDRYAIARAFIAKAVYGFDTTRGLIEGLRTAPNLAKICGFDHRAYTRIREGETESGKVLRVVTRIDSLPSESTFSRAFWEFAENGLGDKVQSEMVKEYVGDQINGHISRDATAINGHERLAMIEIREIQLSLLQKYF